MSRNSGFDDWGSMMYGGGFGNTPEPLSPDRVRAAGLLVFAAVLLVLGLAVGLAGGPPLVLNALGIGGTFGVVAAMGGGAWALADRNKSRAVRALALFLVIGALGAILDAVGRTALAGSLARFGLAVGFGGAALLGLRALAARRGAPWSGERTLASLCALLVAGYAAGSWLAFGGTIRFAGLVLVAGRIARWVMNRRATPAFDPFADIEAPPDPYAHYTAQQRAMITAILRFVSDNFAQKTGWFPEIANVLDSPAFTTYVLTIPTNVNSQQIINRTSDLEMALKTEPNAVAISSGSAQGGVLIQVRKTAADRAKTKVWYDEVVSGAGRMMTGKPFAAAVGKDEMGRPVIVDLDGGDSPHLLICGQSGSGKSYLMHVLMVQLLSKNKPSDLQVAIIDPKGTFGMRYREVPHLFAPAVLGVDSPEEKTATVETMRAVYEEMVRRQEILKARGVSTLRDFRKRFPDEQLPILLLVVDEAADLGGSDDKRVQEAYATYAGHIARKGRALGVLLVLGIQRPTAKNLGENIRGQLAQRIVLRLTDINESGIALNRDKDDAATKLGGRGDGFYISGGMRTRFMGAYLPDEIDDERSDLSVEIAVRDWIVNRYGGPKVWDAAPSGGVRTASVGGAPATGPATPSGPDANAAIAAEHNEGCTDREWLIIRGVELALADQADDFAAVPLSPPGIVPFVARASAERGHGGPRIEADEIFAALGRFFPERDGRPQMSRTFRLSRSHVRRRLVERYAATPLPEAAPGPEPEAAAEMAEAGDPAAERAAAAERVRAIRERERRDP